MIPKTSIRLSAATISILAALFTSAQAGSHKDKAAIDPEAAAVLRGMANQLTAATKIQITGWRTVDPDILPGPHAIGNACVQARISRPDTARIVVRSWGNARCFHLGPKESVVYDHKTKLYARFPGKSTLAETIDNASDTLGIHIPIQDFLTDDPYGDFAHGLKSLRHLGSQRVGFISHDCYHIAGAKDGFKFEIWIAKSDLMPRKLVITLDGVGGSEHYQMRFARTNLKPRFTKADLAFKPPSGAEEIEFLPEDLKD